MVRNHGEITVQMSVVSIVPVIEMGERPILLRFECCSSWQSYDLIVALGITVRWRGK
jgi:hypothetical protein